MERVLFCDCSICEETWEEVLEADEDCQSLCDRCARLVPPSLYKAARDEFDYACNVKGVGTIQFCRAEFHGQWVRLFGNAFVANEREFLRDSRANLGNYPHPRGVDVRLTDIIWCSDAPNGS